MKRRWWVVCALALGCLVGAGCSGSTGTDAGAQPDAAVQPDAAIQPDAAVQPDAVSGGCPNVAEIYTWLQEPGPECPSIKSPTRRAIGVEQAAGSCAVTFQSIPAGAEDRWPWMGTVTIDEAGAFSDGSFTLASQPITCSGVYVPGAPNRYELTCDGGCTFSIRVGE